jgi:23S rRNA (guanosine2251-2'-O)-methyltransferase
MVRSNDIVYGRNPVFELIKAGRRSVNKIIISKTAKGPIISKIISLARQKNITVHNDIPSEKFRKFCQYSQGVIAEVSPIEYIDLIDLIKKSKNSKRQLFVILDSIDNPSNLGAIIRNCVIFNANGIIISKWRTVGINGTVLKSSTGAVEHISISRVANINQAISLLKKHGFWIIGAECNSGQILETVNLSFPLAVIIGSEGFGLHNLVKKNCDFLVSIPQNNTISSLNVSCASAIILYEIFKKYKYK